MTSEMGWGNPHPMSELWPTAECAKSAAIGMPITPFWVPRLIFVIPLDFPHFKNFTTKRPLAIRHSVVFSRDIYNGAHTFPP